MNKVFVPKDDQRLPDYYTVTFNYLSGRKRTLKVASMRYVEKVVDQFGNLLGDKHCGYEIWTFEDRMFFIHADAVEDIEYDGEWTKIFEINREKMAKEKK